MMPADITTPLDLFDRAALEAHLGELARARAAIDARTVLVKRRLDALADAGGGFVPEMVLGDVGRLPRGEVAAVVRRTAVLDVMPMFLGALAAGDVTAEHVARFVRQRAQRRTPATEHGNEPTRDPPRRCNKQAPVSPWHWLRFTDEVGRRSM